MTDQEVKAEAEKIIHLYRDHVAIDYQYDEEPLRNCQIECAIIQVKAQINLVNDIGLIYEIDLEYYVQKFQSILTELENK